MTQQIQTGCEECSGTQHSSGGLYTEVALRLTEFL